VRSFPPRPPPPSSTTIQTAINAADPGDWILEPGVYHEKSNATAGVMITAPGLHLRGLDRNLVVVDGFNGDSTAPCLNDPALQDFTARNGIEVTGTSGVSVENMTVCEYLSDADGSIGNQIWFNGGDRTGKIGRGAWSTTTPDSERPPPGANCGGRTQLSGGVCFFNATATWYPTTRSAVMAFSATRPPAIWQRGERPAQELLLRQRQHRSPANE
jgi:hypothetical protein